MFICKNADCSRSYLSHDGRIVVNLARDLRAAHDKSRTLAPSPIGRLKGLAPRIYQNGQPPCVCCGQLNNLAHHTGPDEPPEVNVLLENIELLQTNGVPI